MHNLAHLEDTALLERPRGQLCREVAIGSRHGLVAQLDLLGEPLVLEKLGRAQNSQARRVVALHGRNEAELLANGEGVLDGLGLVLGVVAVRCAGCAEDGGEHGRVVAEHLANGAGDGDVALTAEVVLDACSQSSGVWEQQNIVLLCSRCGVVVEVVDDGRALGGGDADVKLEEERLDGGRGGLLAGEGDEDVSILLDELEEVVGGQGWAEALRLCGEQ